MTGNVILEFNIFNLLLCVYLSQNKMYIKNIPAMDEHPLTFSCNLKQTNKQTWDLNPGLLALKSLLRNHTKIIYIYMIVYVLK